MKSAGTVALFGLIVLLSFDLCAQLTTGTVDFDVDRLHDMEQVTVSLSDASTMILVREYVVDRTPSSYTWVGSVQSDVTSRAFITVKKPFAVGTIQTSSKLYELTITDEPTDPVQQIDPLTLPNEADPLQEPIFTNGFEDELPQPTQTVSFQGTVISVGGAGYEVTGFNVGDTFWGTYQLQTDVPDAQPDDPTVGTYWGAITNVEVHVNDYILSLASTPYLQIGNDYTGQGDDKDYYTTEKSYFTDPNPNSGDWAPIGFTLVLVDPGASALATDAIPATPPFPSAFVSNETRLEILFENQIFDWKSAVVATFEKHNILQENFFHEGREWRAINDVTGTFSWNQLAQICDVEGSGLCTGSIAGKDLSGWTLATLDEVFAMFEGAAKLPDGSLADRDEHPDFDSPYASNAIIALGATFLSEHSASIEGMTRTTFVSGEETIVFMPYVIDKIDGALGTQDHFQYSGLNVEEFSNYPRGVFLYRQ